MIRPSHNIVCPAPLDSRHRKGRVTGERVNLTYLSDIAQLPKPTMPQTVLGVRSADVIPDTGQPMGDNHVEANQQYQHHGSILDVSIDFSNNSAKP